MNGAGTARVSRGLAGVLRRSARDARARTRAVPGRASAPVLRLPGHRQAAIRRQIVDEPRKHLCKLIDELLLGQADPRAELAQDVRP